MNSVNYVKVVFHKKLMCETRPLFTRHTSKLHWITVEKIYAKKLFVTQETFSLSLQIIRKGHTQRRLNIDTIINDKVQGDHSPDYVKFSDNSMAFPWRFAALLPTLSVTPIMPVLALWSAVGVGMQQCMIGTKTKCKKLRKVKNRRKYAANNKQF